MRKLVCDCVATILKLKLDHTVALCNIYRNDDIFLLINQLIRDLRYLLFLFINLDGCNGLFLKTKMLIETYTRLETIENRRGG